MEFGFVRFPHQRTPHLFAQLGEPWLAQCVARARVRQINGYRLMNNRWPSFKHDDPVTEQHCFFD